MIHWVINLALEAFGGVLCPTCQTHMLDCYGNAQNGGPF